MTITEREKREKRVRIRAWRRGTKEMDLILGPFADRALTDLTDADLDALEALMDEGDNDLYTWVSGSECAPDKYAGTLALLRNFHRIAPPE